MTALLLSSAPCSRVLRPPHSSLLAMSNKTLQLSDTLHRYLLDVSLREPDVLRRLRAETMNVKLSVMQIAPEQGQFMRMLIRLTGAKRCLEIGTYTGYSSLSVALALPDDGRIVCCDVSEEWTSIARRYWQEAGVAHKIELRLAPALETLDGLLAQRAQGTFDFVFIDADKGNYANYYERALQLLRPGGLIAIDNTLWYGHPADANNQEPDTVAIRALNEKLHADARIELSLVPIGDGLSLVRKQG
jgi:predicted O-methyltransferase YrrM